MKAPAKRTPGPWATCGGYVEAGDGLAAEPIAKVCDLSEDRANEEAGNAFLISAAPDLLSSLCYLRDCIERGIEPGMGGVLRAIAKAEGRP